MEDKAYKFIQGYYGILGMSVTGCGILITALCKEDPSVRAYYKLKGNFNKVGKWVHSSPCENDGNCSRCDQLDRYMEAYRLCVSKYPDVSGLEVLRAIHEITKR